LNPEQSLNKDMAKLRLDWRRLLRQWVLLLGLPCSLAMGLDWWLGSLPWITIAAVIVCIPTAAIVISRTALREMDRIIEVVAPPLPEVEPERDPS
jgi:hypothetical protein